MLDAQYSIHINTDGLSYWKKYMWIYYSKCGVDFPFDSQHFLINIWWSKRPQALPGNQLNCWFRNFHRANEILYDWPLYTPSQWSLTDNIQINDATLFNWCTLIWIVSLLCIFITNCLLLSIAFNQTSAAIPGSSAYYHTPCYSNIYLGMRRCRN